jgi:23S rRNA (guanosine2251-2'-O)-methyltransferase
MVYGVHAVSELVAGRAGTIHSLYVLQSLSDDSAVRGLLGLLDEKGIQAQLVPRSTLDRLSRNGVHQGILAFCDAFPYAPDITSLLAQISAPVPLLLALDGVTDPQNLGALIRSTYVLGGHGILLPMNHSASVTASTAKASAGASERLPIAQLPNLVRSLVELRRMDYQIVAAVAPGAGGQRPWQIDLRRPTVFVLGSEGRGMRPMVLKTGTHRVEVPMQPGLRGASLNVSAAGAILLYEALSQRREQPATMAHAAPTP